MQASGLGRWMQKGRLGKDARKQFIGFGAA